MASNCAICWFEKSGLEPDAEIPNEKFIELFTVCKKHKENLKKEIPMADCKKCGSQSTTFKEGISKKPGKSFGQPWKANKCDDCGEMNWIASPKPSFGNPVPAVSGSLEKKVDKILAILEGQFGKATIKQVEDEEAPF